MMRVRHAAVFSVLMCIRLEAQDPPPTLVMADSLRTECIGALKAKDQDRAKTAAATSERMYRARIAASADDAPSRVGLAQLLGECRMALVGMFSKRRVFDEGQALLLDVLSKDSTYWGARFTLAQFYYNAPAFMGHRRDAIRELETLLRQQGDVTDFPELATPYVMLGDLFTREKRPEDARRIWEKGNRLFPHDTRLQQRLTRLSPGAGR